MGFFDKARGKLAVRTNEGASLGMQAQWRSLSGGQKNQLRRTIPDSDRDGVPDKFDCQPFNRRRQDYDPDAEADLQARIKRPRNQDDPFTRSLDRQMAVLREQEARERGERVRTWNNKTRRYEYEREEDDPEYRG